MFENLTLPHLEQRAGISVIHTKQHDIMGCMSFLYGTFANVPEMVNAGCITGHFVSFEASEDQDFIPNEKPLSGTVNITPTVGIMRWPTAHPRRMAVMSAIVCPIIYGDVYPPGTTVEDVDENIIPPGVWVVATDQPEGEPDLVQYTVSFRLDNARVQPDNLTINVPTNGVLDLADVVSASPAPGTITVVSSADRILAEQAANAAILAQQQAEAAANRAETATDGLGAPVVLHTWNGAHTVDAAGVGFMVVSLTGPATVTLSPGMPGVAQTFNLVVTQGGENTLHFPGVLWSEAVAYTPTETAGAKDFLTLTWDGENWWGFVAATGGTA